MTDGSAEATTLQYIRSSDKPASLFTYRAGLFCFIAPLLAHIGCVVGPITKLYPLPPDRYYGALLYTSPFMWAGGLGFGIANWVLSFNDPGHPYPSDQRRGWLVMWLVLSAMLEFLCFITAVGSTGD